MGAPKPPRPVRPPSPTDTSKAQMNALAFAETERKIRRGSGRRSMFLTGDSGGGKSLLGQ